MLFSFKRDDEGRERICVGDVCIAILSKYVRGRVDVIPGTVAGLQEQHVHDAIERADEAGFWAPVWEPIGSRNPRFNRTIVGSVESGHRVAEVTVDVPVADNAVLSVTTGEDES